MAYFNLPFSVRISNDNPVDGDRYLTANATQRSELFSDGRAYEGLLSYHQDTGKLYILDNVSTQTWSEIGRTSDVGTVTSVSSSTTNQLTVANGTSTPLLSIVTGVVSDGGTALATGDQIHTFVTSQGYTKTVSSSTTNQLTVANGTSTPQLSIVTGAVTSDGTSLATGDQIYDFVIGLGYSTTTGTVTSVTAGNGMTQTGTSTINPTLNVVSHTGAAGSIGTINVSVDAIGVNLGTTSTTAFRGDYGNTAYTHAGTTSGSVHGSTTVGGNFLRLTNPSAVRFVRINANNSISALGATDFRTAIGAGTVTSVGTNAPLTGTVTGSGNLSITQATPSTDGYLSSTDWITFNNKTSNTGTVTSVGLSVPTGLSVSGSPVTTFGTIALTFTSGYSIPTTTKQGQWDTAYTNRITSLTTTGTSGNATLTSNTLNIPNYTYTLPLAANGTRGGVQIGYTATGANLPVAISSEKMYVALTKSAIENQLTGNITSHEHSYSTLTLGTTSTTAFRGDYGNTAYTNRITSLTTTGTSGNATLTSNTLNIPNYTYTLTKAGVEGVLTGNITSHTHSYDNYSGWRLYTDTTDRGDISSGEQVRFVGGTNVTIGYTDTNNVITINSTGGGVSWNGSTENAIGTFGSSTTIDAEPNLTFDGNILQLNNNTDKTIKLKDLTSSDSTPQTLNILGAKGYGDYQGTTYITYSTPTHHNNYGNTYTYYTGYDGGDVKIQGGNGATPHPSYWPSYNVGGKGGDLLLYGGDGGTSDGITGQRGDVTIKGGAIVIDSNIVDIGEQLRHIGDADTFLQFTTDRIEFTAGGLKMLSAVEGYAGGNFFYINPTGADVDFYIKGDDGVNDNLVHVEASTSRVGINKNKPTTTLDVNGSLTTNSTVTLSGIAPSEQSYVTIGTNGVLGTTTSAGTTVNFSSDNNIPYMNDDGDNFDYSPNFTFSGSQLKLSVNYGGNYAQTIKNNSSTGDGLQISLVNTSSSSSYNHIYCYTAPSGGGTQTNISKLTAEGKWYAQDFQILSDPRTKNIEGTVTNGLDIVLSLNPINYKWKDRRDDYSHIGFSTTEVKKIRPELVMSGVGDEYDSLSYSMISAINTSAIQQLYKIIDELKKEINQLKNE